MAIREPIFIATTSWIRAQAAIALSLTFTCMLSAGEFSDALSPLKNPSLETAKKSLLQLENIAKSEELPQRDTAAKSVILIKGVYTSEFKVHQLATSGIQDAFASASKMDLDGIEMMEPNTMGSINNIGASNKFKKAAETRSRAITRIQNANADLKSHIEHFDKELNSMVLTDADMIILKNISKSLSENSLTLSEQVVARALSIHSSRPKLIREEIAKNELLREKEKNDKMFKSKMMCAYRAANKAGDHAGALRILDAIEKRENGLASYIGNKGTKIVHSIVVAKGDCQIKELEEHNNAVYIHSLIQAEADGYAKCLNCLKE